MQTVEVPASEASALSTETRIALHEAMTRLRVVNDTIDAWVEVGELPFIASTKGREAALAGAVFALDSEDWAFGNARDWCTPLLRTGDSSLKRLVNRVFGNAADPLLGHDVPTGTSDRANRIASTSAPAATHLPHAVGLVWAAQQRGEKGFVSAAFFDGSEVDAPDFHTGLNFAGVMKTPTLFICRARDGEPTAAEFAENYGLMATACDGSDVASVYATIRAARRRALEGQAQIVDVRLGDSDPLELSRRMLTEAEAIEASVQHGTRQGLESALIAQPDQDPAVASIFEHVFEPAAHHEAQRETAEK